ncbi:ZYBA0S05-03906g1_1 [Zygosaccharomyces bailii CLIB 213]|uniref:ZYBA0S05-03906g1_1 n=1 Tax=Zygosaccharomyces bailii (strain CLIB 213 / ATCC 58445 / CBS 680 / BCRC 21525 / NBRC 1098 / NCYC 1416 / NRRL Y-2227) TaxID=1333698 RepID=A0A8J2T829_ZYGB2|nr:ZYBA0S05-03906g1_1 [Zygosaccharomyces bailii CLIB 213]
MIQYMRVRHAWLLLFLLQVVSAQENESTLPSNPTLQARGDSVGPNTSPITTSDGAPVVASSAEAFADTSPSTSSSETIPNSVTSSATASPTYSTGGYESTGGEAVSSIDSSSNAAGSASSSSISADFGSSSESRSGDTVTFSTTGYTPSSIVASASTTAEPSSMSSDQSPSQLTSSMGGGSSSSASTDISEMQAGGSLTPAGSGITNSEQTSSNTGTTSSYVTSNDAEDSGRYVTSSPPRDFVSYTASSGTEDSNSHLAQGSTSGGDSYTDPKATGDSDSYIVSSGTGDSSSYLAASSSGSYLSLGSTARDSGSYTALSGTDDSYATPSATGYSGGGTAAGGTKDHSSYLVSSSSGSFGSSISYTMSSTPGGSTGNLIPGSIASSSSSLTSTSTGDTVDSRILSGASSSTGDVISSNTGGSNVYVSSGNAYTYTSRSTADSSASESTAVSTDYEIQSASVSFSSSTNSIDTAISSAYTSSNTNEESSTYVLSDGSSISTDEIISSASAGDQSSIYTSSSYTSTSATITGNTSPRSGTSSPIAGESDSRESSGYTIPHKTAAVVISSSGSVSGGSAASITSASSGSSASIVSPSTTSSFRQLTSSDILTSGSLMSTSLSMSKRPTSASNTAQRFTMDSSSLTDSSTLQSETISSPNLQSNSEYASTTYETPGITTMPVDTYFFLPSSGSFTTSQDSSSTSPEATSFVSSAMTSSTNVFSDRQSSTLANGATGSTKISKITSQSNSNLPQIESSSSPAVVASTARQSTSAADPSSRPENFFGQSSTSSHNSLSTSQDVTASSLSNAVTSSPSQFSTTSSSAPTKAATSLTTYQTLPSEGRSDTQNTAVSSSNAVTITSDFPSQASSGLTAIAVDTYISPRSSGVVKSSEKPFPTSQETTAPLSSALTSSSSLSSDTLSSTLTNAATASPDFTSQSNSNIPQIETTPTHTSVDPAAASTQRTATSSITTTPVDTFFRESLSQSFVGPSREPLTSSATTVRPMETLGSTSSQRSFNSFREATTSLSSVITSSPSQFSNTIDSESKNIYTSLTATQGSPLEGGSDSSITEVSSSIAVEASSSIPLQATKDSLTVTTPVDTSFEESSASHPSFSSTQTIINPTSSLRSHTNTPSSPITNQPAGPILTSEASLKVSSEISLPASSVVSNGQNEQSSSTIPVGIATPTDSSVTLRSATLRSRINPLSEALASQRSGSGIKNSGTALETPEASDLITTSSLLPNTLSVGTFSYSQTADASDETTVADTGAKTTAPLIPSQTSSPSPSSISAKTGTLAPTESSVDVTGSNGGDQATDSGGSMLLTSSKSDAPGKLSSTTLYSSFEGSTSQNNGNSATNSMPSILASKYGTSVSSSGGSLASTERPQTVHSTSVGIDTSTQSTQITGQTSENSISSPISQESTTATSSASRILLGASSSQKTKGELSSSLNPTSDSINTKSRAVTGSLSTGDEETTSTHSHFSRGKGSISGGTETSSEGFQSNMITFSTVSTSSSSSPTGSVIASKSSGISPGTISRSPKSSDASLSKPPSVSSISSTSSVTRSAPSALSVPTSPSLLPSTSEHPSSTSTSRVIGSSAYIQSSLQSSSFQVLSSPVLTSTSIDSSGHITSAQSSINPLGGNSKSSLTHSSSIVTTTHPDAISPNSLSTSGATPALPTNSGIGTGAASQTGSISDSVTSTVQTAGSTVLLPTSTKNTITTFTSAIISNTASSTFPRGSDSSTNWLPYSIIIQSTRATSSTSPFNPNVTATLPHAIAPATSVAEPPGSAVITVGFKRQINYAFLVSSPLSSAQIFNFLPDVLTYPFEYEARMQNSQPHKLNGSSSFHHNRTITTLKPNQTIFVKSYRRHKRKHLNASDVKVVQIMPILSQDKGYLVSVAELYFPSHHIEKLRAFVNDPHSRLYNNTNSTLHALADLIDPSIPLTGMVDGDGNVNNGNSGNSGASDGNHASQAANNNGNEDMKSGSLETSNTSSSITSVITKRLAIYLTSFAFGTLLWISSFLVLFKVIRKCNFAKNLTEGNLEKVSPQDLPKLPSSSTLAAKKSGSSGSGQISNEKVSIPPAQDVDNNSVNNSVIIGGKPATNMVPESSGGHSESPISDDLIITGENTMYSTVHGLEYFIGDDGAFYYAGNRQVSDESGTTKDDTGELDNLDNYIYTASEDLSIPMSAGQQVDMSSLEVDEEGNFVLSSDEFCESFHEDSGGSGSGAKNSETVESYNNNHLYKMIKTSDEEDNGPNILSTSDGVIRESSGGDTSEDSMGYYNNLESPVLPDHCYSTPYMIGTSTDDTNNGLTDLPSDFDDYVYREGEGDGTFMSDFDDVCIEDIDDGKVDDLQIDDFDELDEEMYQRLSKLMIERSIASSRCTSQSNVGGSKNLGKFNPPVLFSAGPPVTASQSKSQMISRQPDSDRYLQGTSANKPDNTDARGRQSMMKEDAKKLKISAPIESRNSLGW